MTTLTLDALTDAVQCDTVELMEGVAVALLSNPDSEHVRRAYELLEKQHIFPSRLRIVARTTPSSPEEDFMAAITREEAGGIVFRLLQGELYVSSESYRMHAHEGPILLASYSKPIRLQSGHVISAGEPREDGQQSGVGWRVGIGW